MARKINHQEFEKIFAETVEIAEKTLIKKAQEYADNSDRLHNFNTAAELGKSTPVWALAGMMIKHTVSIYDMLADYVDHTTFTKEQWDEKIMDHINYLILLRAVLYNDRFENEVANG